MSSLHLLTLLLPVHVAVAQLPIFDPSTCHNMCRKNENCPPNAACQSVTSTAECGICQCTFGFSPNGSGQCVMKDGQRTTTTAVPATTDDYYDDLGAASTETVPTTTKISTAVATTTTTTPNPRILVQTWQCRSSQKECDPSQVPSNNAESAKDPLVVALTDLSDDCRKSDIFLGPVQCPNAQGGNNVCAGGSQCLRVNDSISYCACAYHKSGPTCHTEKPPGCSATTGSLRGITEESGKRFRHRRLTHTGSIYARHVVPNVEHCVRLCEWVGALRCRSFNLGKIGDELVCELLSVGVEKNTSLTSWLVDDRLFDYYCCFK